ncbi:MAG TPA: DegT/DnrJ/EryC1/StrS aminotransferase family protein [Candidatus Dormibacteraeota bacterium]
MIPITRPSLDEEEVTAAAAVIRSGWLSQGKRVDDFEQAVCAYVGAEHGIAVSNCTTALHLALLAAGVRPGDEVICPSFSFIATANAILHAGAVPVFADIDPRTYNIDAGAVETAISKRTRAIMPVDQIGLAADLRHLRDLARAHRLAVVEDAAPSLGATFESERVGSRSPLTCFSFHPRKSITTGEGGMITTNDREVAGRLRRLRSHGASISDLDRHESDRVRFESYDELGFNYRMTDIQAAIGCVQIAKLERILAARSAAADRYSEMLAGDERLRLPYAPAGCRHTYQSYCVQLPSEDVRAVVMSELASQGIATRRGVMAIHLEPLYRERFPAYSLPITERASRETMLLPLYADMSEAETETVVDALQRALDKAFSSRYTRSLSGRGARA